MRWSRSAGDDKDVIDQRGVSGGGGMGGLGGGGVKIGGGAGIVGIIIAVAVLLLSGGDGGSGSAFGVQDPFGTGSAQTSAGGAIPADQDPEKDLRDFSAYVFSNVQNTWSANFDQAGKPYQRAKLLLYRGGVNTACGSATSAVGPFYCPGDQRVYLDLSFYRDMQDKLGASGDFAWAYVVAHELGHHVQNLLGTEQQVRRLQAKDPGKVNELSVRLELQADCYAGVWAHKVQQDLEPGDADEALGAASAVGDDRLQKAATGRIQPDTFTHGSSAQRVRWFRTGQQSGDPSACDTFSPASV